MHLPLARVVVPIYQPSNDGAIPNDPINPELAQTRCWHQQQQWMVLAWRVLDLKRRLLTKSIFASVVACSSAAYKQMSLCCSANLNHSSLYILGIKFRFTSQPFLVSLGSFCKWTHTRSVNDLWTSTRSAFADSNSGWWSSTSKWPARIASIARSVSCDSSAVLSPGQCHRKPNAIWTKCVLVKSWSFILMSNNLPTAITVPLCILKYCIASL